MIESVVGTLKKVATQIAVFSGKPQFSCADCERWQRCGLPPSETCLIKLERLSRDDRVLNSRVSALGPW